MRRGRLFRGPNITGLIYQLMKLFNENQSKNYQKRYHDHNKRSRYSSFNKSQYKDTKICRKCGKRFIPKKSYYHTCPECF